MLYSDPDPLLSRNVSDLLLEDAPDPVGRVIKTMSTRGLFTFSRIMTPEHHWHTNTASEAAAVAALRLIGTYTDMIYYVDSTSLSGLSVGRHHICGLNVQ